MRRRDLISGSAAVLALSSGPAFAQNLRPGQPPTNIDEAKVRTFTLPDPLRTQGGQTVRDPRTWTTVRRPEIMNLFEQHQFGVTPAGKPAVRFEVVDDDVPAFDGLARRTQARIRFPGAREDLSIRVLLYLPAEARGRVPTLLHLGFSPAVLVINDQKLDEGMAWNGATKSRVPDRQARRVGEFNARYFVERGYAVAYVYYGDIEGDFQGAAQLGVRSLFGAQAETRKPDDWGAIGAWSWGLSRVMDYLQTHPRVDGRKVALSGVSRLGKTVLWAGAKDQRFAVVIPLLSGEGGAAISRRNYGETIADLTNPARYAYWYAPRYDSYAFNVDALPVDGHMLLSLIAPRPVLQITGSTDTWSDPKGEWVAAQAAQPVYALFGKRGPGNGPFPAAGVRILNDMGWFMHEGEHTTLPIDFWVMANFMDKHFGKPAGG
jgi:hypothetical protein